MNAEKRTARAIGYTRFNLERWIDNPHQLIQMATFDVTPEEIEDKIAEILEYLEKTKPDDYDVVKF